MMSPKPLAGINRELGTVGLRGKSLTFNKGCQRQAARQDYRHETERELR